MAQITLNSTGVASSGALVLQSNGTTAAVTIDTSQRAAFVAGTAALPSITTTGDTNTGIFFPAADTIAFAEGGVECARFDSAGNFGLGNTNPASYNSAADNLVIGTLGNNGMTIVSGPTSSGYIMFADGTTGQQAYEGQITYDHTNNFMALNTNGTERARIDSSGNLLVGTTSATSGSRFQVKGSTTTDAVLCFRFENSASTQLLAALNAGQLYTGSAAASPYNNTTGSGANLFVASDGLLQRSTSSLKYKTDVTDATHGLTDLLKLRSVTYKGKNDGGTVFGGLIAEEVHDAGLTEFVQYAQDGSPDALSYGNMISLCVKSTQEQQALITQLTARISALESA